MSVSLNKNTILQTSTYIQVLLVSLGPVYTTANTVRGHPGDLKSGRLIEVQYK